MIGSEWEVPPGCSIRKRLAPRTGFYRELYPCPPIVPPSIVPLGQEGTSGLYVTLVAIALTLYRGRWFREGANPRNLFASRVGHDRSLEAMCHK